MWLLVQYHLVILSTGGHFCSHILEYRMLQHNLDSIESLTTTEMQPRLGWTGAGSLHKHFREEYSNPPSVTYS